MPYWPCIQTQCADLPGKVSLSHHTIPLKTGKHGPRIVQCLPLAFLKL